MKQIAIIIIATLMSVTYAQAQAQAPSKPTFIQDTSLCQVLVQYRAYYNLNNETIAHTLSKIATESEGYHIEYSEKDIHDMLTCNYCLLPKSDKAVRKYIRETIGKRP